ncbi:hypothetical protein Hypma_009480 [Hypsizygus marmoreus]|uniref:Uncharacterized protein n=1 Tax=Hypsizygus marmoreus TaxID=39966 RepID=A0A369JRS5_HYPMA|nr:hypothetical protein Hypma_009480 [Hypsizygus marmoreus]
MPDTSDLLKEIVDILWLANENHILNVGQVHAYSKCIRPYNNTALIPIITRHSSSRIKSRVDVLKEVKLRAL